MTHRRQPAAALVAVAALVVPALAAAQESRLGAEFHLEARHLEESCGSLKTTVSCAMTVATGHPVHLAIGSIAPGNGVALGASFSTSYAPTESWRVTWSGDAVRAFGGSWRAGGYLKLIHTPSPSISLAPTPAAGTSAADLAVRPHAVVNLYAQTTTLADVDFYGLGPDSIQSARASFGLRATTVGASGVLPVNDGGRFVRRLNLAVLGEINGRFHDVRDGSSPDVPTLGAVAGADGLPGLARQPTYVQIGAVARLEPDLGRYARLNYLAGAQRYITGTEGLSFTRWRIDLDHEFLLYGTSGPPDTRDTNTPNDCLTGPGAGGCPPISRDRRGAIHVRALLVTTPAAVTSVPFYLQPTIGGSDINGAASLASFSDYRFRAPHLFLLRQSIEHSIWGPVGAWLEADQGRVALTRSGLGDSTLRKTVAAGLTIRAGGFPMVVASYAVGGGEGRHVAFTINTSLLGGSARPAVD